MINKIQLILEIQLIMKIIDYKKDNHLKTLSLELIFFLHYQVNFLKKNYAINLTY